MPHQHPDSADATFRDTLGYRPPRHGETSGDRSNVSEEPRSYAAFDAADATEAMPDAQAHWPSEKTVVADPVILRHARAD